MGVGWICVASQVTLTFLVRPSSGFFFPYHMWALVFPLPCLAALITKLTPSLCWAHILIFGFDIPKSVGFRP